MTLFFVLGLVVVLVVGVVRSRRRRRRARELAEWAAREDWTSAESDPSVRAIGCGPAEHGATERHVLRGTPRDGWPTTAFEARYRVRHTSPSDGEGGRR